jgi:hypothetical protein
VTSPWRNNDGHMPFGRKLSTAQIQEIRRRREAGERATDLAKEFGVSRYTIQNYTRGTLR